MCIGELGTVQIYASPIFEYQGLALMGEGGGTILLGSGPIKLLAEKEID